MNNKIYESHYLCLVCIRNILFRFPFGQFASSNDVTHREMKRKNMDFCALNIQNSALFSLIIQMREWYVNCKRSFVHMLINFTHSHFGPLVYYIVSLPCLWIALDTRWRRTDFRLLNEIVCMFNTVHLSIYKHYKI